MRITVSTLASSLTLAACASTAQAEAPFAFATTPGKLPKNVVPQQYAVHLIPDLKTKTFLGSETVEIDISTPTSVIMLNAANLVIDAAGLSGKHLPELKLLPVLDKEQETLTFKLDKELPAGRYNLSLKFHGQLNREARGMYVVPYDGNKEMIATNMEPADARRMLPVWDEPAFRAKFRLTVDVPASFNAYSNTPVEKQERVEGGMQRVTFGTTPKMSSYLFVLVAGELERSSLKQDGVDMGVVTTAGKQAMAGFALNNSRDLMRYFNNYFGMNYTLPKLDHIAVPGGFSGTMENWGGIVYNESTILYDPKKSPERVKWNSFHMTAHEMAHQWFGNLVAMAWWDNLWLNEGFASWMGTKASAHFHPEWRPWLDTAAEREGVFNLDARKSTHAVQQPITTEAQAAAAFDTITYGKGHAFLRMLEAYLGEEAFRKGIRNFINKHQYSNTTSADLWAALEKTTGKPVEKLALDWTTQPGFPVIKVEQNCVDGWRMVKLSQEQFRLDEPAAEKRLWSVPVQVGLVNGKSSYTLLDTASTTISQTNCDGALVVDPYSVGFYRVQYDKTSFDALANQVAKLPDTTRLKLLTDTWAMVMAGRLQLDTYLSLANKYGDESRLAVWDILTSNMTTMHAVTRDTPERELVRKFNDKLLNARFAKLGWEDRPGESVEDKQLRSLLAFALAQAGDEATIKQARERFLAFQANPASLSPTLVDFVIYTAGKHADEPIYEALTKLALSTTVTEERNRYIGALSNVRDPVLSARTLALALREDLPVATRARIVPNVARNGHIEQAWDFVVKHAEQLSKIQESVGISRMFPTVVSGSNETAKADMMEAYVEKNFSAEVLVEAKRIGDGIRVRAKQKDLLLPQIRAALK